MMDLLGFLAVMALVGVGLGALWNEVELWARLKRVGRKRKPKGYPQFMTTINLLGLDRLEYHFQTEIERDRFHDGFLEGCEMLEVALKKADALAPGVTLRSEYGGGAKLKRDGIDEK